jgi:hypothetical protein
MTRRTRCPALAALGLVLALAACGGDADTSAPSTATGTGPARPAATDALTTGPAVSGTAGTEVTGTVPTGTVAAELAEYCALSLELDQQQGMPTAEQMTTILAAAPDEVADLARTFVDAYVAAGDDVDPSIFTEYGEELAAIDAFDAEHCGISNEGEEPPDPEVVTIDPTAARVDVDATDFHFAFEPPTEAGRYSFVMTNDGAEAHMMILAQMEPGATFEDVMASEGEEGLVQSFESIPSGPGGESVVTADLTSGHWILVCPIPSEANAMQPHAALGMVHEWDIT